VKLKNQFYLLSNCPFAAANAQDDLAYDWKIAYNFRIFKGTVVTFYRRGRQALTFRYVILSGF